MREAIKLGVYSYKEFSRLVALPLEDKVTRTEQIILHALKNATTPAVSCSWGKDSIVMVYLVRKFCKNALILFANTGVEYPETYRYRDKMLKEWSLKEVYFESKPIKGFWQCVKEYGYPTMRLISSQRGTKQEHDTPKCCIFLKERPLDRLAKKLKVDTSFIGLQATESMNRRLLFLHKGEYYFNKKRKQWVVLPLAIWTDKDIFSYIKKEKIPLSELYKKFSRNGCMYCTGFKDWKKKMAKFNLKIYQKVLWEKEGQKTIQDCNL